MGESKEGRKTSKTEKAREKIEKGCYQTGKFGFS
jgi:hypothetical protein